MVWAKAARGVWGQGHVFDGKLYLTHDICKHDQIPGQLKVPVKSKPAKLAAKRLETELHSLRCLPILSLYLNCPLSMSRSSRLFAVVKRSFTQCLWRGHAHRSNVMFQCDSHYRCCACIAAVLKCYGWWCYSTPQGGKRHFVTPPPPWGEPSQYWGGKITRGA